VEHAPPGKARKRLERMLAPFQALLERYPASGSEPAPAPAEEEPGPSEVPALG